MPTTTKRPRCKHCGKAHGPAGWTMMQCYGCHERTCVKMPKSKRRFRCLTCGATLSEFPYRVPRADLGPQDETLAELRARTAGYRPGPTGTPAYRDRIPTKVWNANLAGDHWTYRWPGRGYAIVTKAVRNYTPSFYASVYDAAGQEMGQHQSTALASAQHWAEQELHQHRPAPRGPRASAAQDGLGTPWLFTRQRGGPASQFWTVEMPRGHRSGAAAFRIGPHPFQPGWTVDILPPLGPWESFFRTGRDVFPSPHAAAQALVAELHATHRW
jgi:hypothetical protein